MLPKGGLVLRDPRDRSAAVCITFRPSFDDGKWHSQINSQRRILGTHEDTETRKGQETKESGATKTRFD